MNLKERSECSCALFHDRRQAKPESDPFLARFSRNVHFQSCGRGISGAKDSPGTRPFSSPTILPQPIFGDTTITRYRLPPIHAAVPPHVMFHLQEVATVNYRIHGIDCSDRRDDKANCSLLNTCRKNYVGISSRQCTDPNLIAPVR